MKDGRALAAGGKRGLYIDYIVARTVGRWGVVGVDPESTYTYNYVARTAETGTRQSLF